MPTLATTARNAAVDAVVDLVDAGAGAGKLIFATSGDVTVAALTFSDPAFSAAGSATAGVATAAAITSDTNAAGGTIAKCRIQDSAPATVMAVTVGTSGQEINLSSLAIGAGDTVAVSSLTVTMPAS
jgi:hypothetical protein